MSLLLVVVVLAFITGYRIRSGRARAEQARLLAENDAWRALADALQASRDAWRDCAAEESRSGLRARLGPHAWLLGKLEDACGQLHGDQPIALAIHAVDREGVLTTIEAGKRGQAVRVVQAWDDDSDMPWPAGVRVPDSPEGIGG
jgi:hypothetical protein